ncbi:MAG: acyltransferase family protein [Clostridiales bacterium]|nr:acyltransferase family protein [Clostridiales bacterium]
MQKERNSSLEILRIICIFFVIFWHSLGPYLNEISGLNLADAVMINAFTNNTNLIFMMISGYFSMRFNLEKLIKLDLCIIFYDLLFMFLTGNFGLKTLITCFLPITFENHWFVSCYFVIALFSGFLNQIPEKLNRTSFRNLLLLLLFVFYVMPTVFFHELIEDTGKGVVCMTIMYLVGRYIRLYYSEHHFRKTYLAVIFFVTTLVAATLNYALTTVKGVFMGMYCRDNSIFIVITAVCLFLFFREFHFTNRIINHLALSVVFLYCIEGYMRQIFNRFTDLPSHVNDWYFVGEVLIYAIGVLAACLALHEARYFLLDRFDGFLAKQITRIVDHFTPAVKQGYEKVHDGVLGLLSKS